MDTLHAANAVLQISAPSGISSKEEWRHITTDVLEAINVAVDSTIFHDSRPLTEPGSPITVESATTSVLEYTFYHAGLPSEGTAALEDNLKSALKQCHELRKSDPVQDVERKHNVQIIILPLPLHEQHQSPGLAIFDMDSTLIQQEVIDELARSVGRYEKVAAVTEAAMRGELDFEASLRARVAELKGVETGIWERLKAEVITFTPGAKELIRFLKGKGWKTAVLSGGFTPLAYWVKDILGLDYAFANQLAVDETTSTLSGELLPGAPIVGAAKKRELLLHLAKENDIPLSRTIAVGDGSNDLLMMQAAGLGIAFNAKPKVQEAAPARMNTRSLLDVAFVLGYSGEEIKKTLGEEGDDPKE